MMNRKLRTWKRIAFPAVIFLAAAVFLAGKALITNSSLRTEKNSPCLLAAAVDDTSVIPAITGFPGVSACSEVLTVNAHIQAGVWEGDFSIFGLSADLISGSLITGILFPDETAMPYLVINKTALSAFSRSDVPAGSVPDAADLTGMTVLLDDTYAKICGVISDDLTSPRVFMSAGSARTFLISHGTIPAADTAWVRLRSADSAESVIDAVSRLGCPVTGMDIDTSSWELEEMKIRYMLLSAFIAASAAAASLQAAIHLDCFRSGEKFSAKENLFRILIVSCCGLSAGGIILLLSIARNH